MKSRSWVVVVALLALVMAAGDVAGQSFQGSMRGVVKDAQGVIPGVTVTLLNEENGTTRETVTNETGEYSFPALTPGTFTVRASVPGFKAFERKGQRVSVQAAVALDIVLEVGGIEETITVSGEAPTIDTANASTGGVIGSKELESIPTAGRSVFLMANLEPTVQSSGDAHWNRMQDQSGNSSVSMGGGAVRANNYLIDGFPITDMQNRASSNPSMEAVDEMKVQVHTYDAEMGRTGGGVFNLTARSGVNTWTGSGYTVLRPEALVDQLLLDRLAGKPKVVEYWRNGGGGGGGPIIKNKTFFWVAGEKYVNDQPQNNAFLVPTNAEKAGDFSGLTRGGVAITIKDPLTGVAFPGNIIPASRIDPVGKALMSYMPTADTQVDNGGVNFSMTDLLPSKAYQFTTKVDHHFNNSFAASAFILRQVTSEANANYNPVNKFVGGSFQLERVINTLVVNATYVVSPTTVLTVRAGNNTFDDNYVLPFEFDGKSLGWPSSLTSAFSDNNRFPSTAMTGYKSTGWSSRSDTQYYQWGVNGTLSRLAGSHSVKMGGDYRLIGAKGNSFGTSNGSYTFTDGYSGNAAANMMLGYFTTTTVPLNTAVNGFVNYYSGYVQDDWRVSDKLTLNYGVRLERETGLIEENNFATVDFDQTVISPLNSQVNLINPVTGVRRQILGGLIYAGVNGAPTEQGDLAAVNFSPRVGVVYSFDDKTVVRGGYGTFYAPYNYSSPGVTGWGQIGYSATSQTVNPSGTPIYTLSNPYPNGLIQPSGNTLGLLTGAGGDITYVDPTHGQPKVHQYSVDFQRELPGAVNLSAGYTGLKSDNMSWGASVNINQLDPKYQSLLTSTSTQVPNPFFGVTDAGQFTKSPTLSIGQLLRPFPQFDAVTKSHVMGAHSLYHAAIFQVRKRSTGWWGGQASYTWSRLNDNQFGASNYYSSAPGLQNIYEVVPESPYYDPDKNYDRSLLDSPHKLVIAPSFNLPFGKGKPYFSDSTVGDILLGGWTITPVVTFSSGFPMGITQNVNTPYNFLMGGTPRPNTVPGQDFLVPGDITDRITANTADNLWYNKAAFSTAAANTFGNAPRMLPGVLSPWRNNMDVSIGKNFRTGGRTNASVRIEILNMLNQVQWASPASSAFGNSSFGQVRNQANNMRMVQFTLRFQF